MTVPLRLSTSMTLFLSSRTTVNTLLGASASSSPPRASSFTACLTASCSSGSARPPASCSSWPPPHHRNSPDCKTTLLPGILDRIDLTHALELSTEFRKISGEVSLVNSVLRNFELQKRYLLMGAFNKGSVKFREVPLTALIFIIFKTLSSALANFTEIQQISSKMSKF